MRRYAGAGPLADYRVGQRVMTREGFAGKIDDIHEGPEDLTTYWVTLDNKMGGGEYAEAEIWPLEQRGAQVATVERTAADDYPELGSILAERPPPEITSLGARTGYQQSGETVHVKGQPYTVVLAPPQSGALVVEDAQGKRFMFTQGEVDENEGRYADQADKVAARLALYLPPVPPEQERASTTDLGPRQKAGYDEGFSHGKEGVTRTPSVPTDSDFMAGYDVGWSEGVLVFREPANSWDSDELADAQVAGTVPDTTMIDSVSPGTTLASLESTEAGWSDWLAGDPKTHPNGWGGVGHVTSYDWCRFRRDSHCWLPKGLNEEASKQAGYAVWEPEDRGHCFRIKWADQQVCPTGEPGPNTGAGFLDATVSWEQGGQRGGVPSGQYRASSLPPSTSSMEFTATWADVRRKAKRIRTSGGVRVVASRHGSVVGHVRGDHGVYETEINAHPGKQNVAFWHCGCKWASYSWGRSGPWKRFEGRMCSHALALQYEAQARSMFGRDLSLDEKQPEWMDGVHVHRPGDYDRTNQRYTHKTAALPEGYRMVSDAAKRQVLVVFADKPVGILNWVPEREVWGGHWNGDHTEIVSELIKRPAQVVDIRVKKEHQRQGLATAMWQEANRLSPGLKHDDIQTDEGMVWMDSVSVAKPAAAEFDPEQDGQDIAPVTLWAHALLAEATPYKQVRAMLVAQGVDKPVEIVKAARSKTFRARLRGIIQTLLLEPDGVKDQHKNPVAAKDVLYPGYDPVKGLNPHENGPHVGVTAAKDTPGWLINGKPYSDGVWIEVKPDVWYRGTARPDIPARMIVAKKDGKWAWEAQVLTFINAPHEYTGWQKSGKNPSGTAKTLEAAQEKALASLTKDHEFFRRYVEKQRGRLLNSAVISLVGLLRQVWGSGTDLVAAARAMLTLARRNEPATTAFMEREERKTNGELVGLPHKFKSEQSLVRKMTAEAGEWGGDAGKTAINMSDTLRYTMLYPPENYTQATKTVLGDLNNSGYDTRVKNYWGRGDAYNGINVACHTPRGHPFELQFHTEASFSTKETKVHPLFEKWRDTSTPPKERARLGAQMRDMFDMVHRPPGALGISTRKSQPKPGDIPDYHPAPLRAATLHEGAGHYRYLLLHTLYSGQPVTVLREFIGEHDNRVEVWRDGGWVEDNEYGRYVYLGEPRTDEITEEQARAFTEDTSKEGALSDQAENDFEDLLAMAASADQKDQMPKEGTMHAADEFGSLFSDEVLPVPGAEENAAWESAHFHGALTTRPLDEWGLNVTEGFTATQHDEPEPALPSTDGTDEPDEDKVAARLSALLNRSPVPAPTPAPQPLQAQAGFPLCAKGCQQSLSADLPLVNTDRGLAHAQCPGGVPRAAVRAVAAPAGPAVAETPQERGRRLLAYVDASLSGQQVQGPNPFTHLLAGQDDNELAAAASNYLSTGPGLQAAAVKTYTQTERKAIIDEGQDEDPAANLDRLDITGTHYEALDQISSAAVSRRINGGRDVPEDEDMWMLDGEPNLPDM